MVLDLAMLQFRFEFSRMRTGDQLRGPVFGRRYGAYFAFAGSGGPPRAGAAGARANRPNQITVKSLAVITTPPFRVANRTWAAPPTPSAS